MHGCSGMLSGFASAFRPYIITEFCLFVTVICLHRRDVVQCVGSVSSK